MPWTSQDDLPTTGDGALLTLELAKAYLRVEGTDEDVVIGDLIAAAEALLASRIGRVIIAKAVSESRSVGRNSRGFGVKNWPIDASEAITVTDPDGNEVASIFDVDYPTGRFRASHVITPGTYTVAYTGGVSLQDEWESYEDILRGAARDLVAEWFANRDPGASSVTDGDMSRVTASSVTGATDGLPPRVEGVIKLLRGW